MSAIRLTHIAAVMAMALFLVACGGTSPIADREGNTVYTQQTMWADGNKHLTTNYSVGLHVPVNTQVEVVDTSAEEIVLRIPELDDRTVHIINAENHTQQDISGIYDRYFGQQPVDLSRFDSETREAIEAGEVQEGMSKEAVLLARGHPPAHRTPSTDQDSWTYWRNRFNRRVIHFEDDRVARIQD